jgi:hypothetical protein
MYYVNWLTLGLNCLKTFFDRKIKELKLVCKMWRTRQIVELISLDRLDRLTSRKKWKYTMQLYFYLLNQSN